MPVPHLILGIDPGLTGGISLLDPAYPASVKVWDMPQVDKAVDSAELAAIVRRASPSHVVLEKVGPMPCDGVRQAFSFGQSYATARVVALMLEIPLFLVRPQAWKGYFHLPGGDAGKERGRDLALRRFPASAASFNLKKHHNRAEAALIALYGLEKLLPTGGVAPTSSPSAAGVPD